MTNIEDYLFTNKGLEYDYYKKQLNLHWVSEDFDFSKDTASYKSCKPFHRNLFEKITTFFLLGDGKVSESLVYCMVDKLKKEGTSACCFLFAQSQNETIHAETYRKAAEDIMGLQRLEKIIPELQTLKCVIDKIDYIGLAEDSDKLSIGKKMVRLACGEGIFFMTQFAILGYFRSIGIFNEFTASNNLIMRDEILHAQHKCEYAKMYLKKEEIEEAREDLKRACELEIEFVKYLLLDKENDLEGEYIIDPKILYDYAKHRTNQIGIVMGLGEVYDRVENLPDWLNLLGGSTKDNFYELRRGTEYQMNVQDSGKSIKTNDVNIHSDDF